MLPFKLIYSDRYYLPIGQHVFPAEKYRLVREHLLDTKVAEAADFLEPPPAKDRDVLRVHTSEYVYKLQNGTLTAREELEMEIPFSYELVDAFWLAAGGSILAAQHALQDGAVFNIGGGFHHAHPNHGEGFCMIHDVAVAIRRMQKDGRVQRVMVIDCDVHQGNGTAVIFGPQDRTELRLPPVATEHVPGTRGQVSMLEGSFADVFTISLHQENNYPALKPPSSIDVNLPDGCPDEAYLRWLDRAVSAGFQKFTPELICYVAGADPYREDQLGGLALTIDGLKRRDEYLFRTARERGIPVMVSYAGGYARRVEDTVRIHSNTVVAAAEVYASATQARMA